MPHARGAGRNSFPGVSSDGADCSWPLKASEKREGCSGSSWMTHCTLACWVFHMPAAAGTGRSLLCSIVFLNAFLNNSNRKHDCLASGHPDCLVLISAQNVKAGLRRLQRSLATEISIWGSPSSSINIPGDLKQGRLPLLPVALHSLKSAHLFHGFISCKYKEGISRAWYFVIEPLEKWILKWVYLLAVSTLDLIAPETLGRKSRKRRRGIPNSQVPHMFF